MKKICEVCGQEFITYPSRLKFGFGRFCSKKCKDRWAVEQSKSKGEHNHFWKGGKEKRICKTCGKEFEEYPCRPKKYCSPKCVPGKQAKETVITTCAFCGKEFYATAYRRSIGRGEYCSRSCYIKRRTKDGLYNGKNNPKWRGGITPKNQLIRISSRYQSWRETVFNRDNWTCVFCGIRCQKGTSIVLHADHIKSFALYPELRFEVSNGRTLCKNCHMKLHGLNKKERLTNDVSNSDAIRELAARI